MKKVFLYVVIGLILLAIPATVYLVGQQQDIRKRAAPATTLMLSPVNITKNVGDSFKINVDIDPATNQVTTAKVYLTFDPTILEATAITNGASAPRVLNSGVVQSGTASITVGAASNAQPISARGTVAVVTFTAKSGTGTTPTAVQFASNTFVGGMNDETANVIAGTVPAQITVSGAAPIVTMSPSATPSATPKATVTPKTTLTPTLTPALPSTGSATASSSAIQIVEATPSSGLSSSQPTIQGKGPPGSTVTITIYSEPKTVTVTVDADGNWSYTPTEPLEAGPHNIVASVVTASGATETDSTSIVVEGDSDIPVSGSVEMTIMLIGIGTLLFLSGLLFI